MKQRFILYFSLASIVLFASCTTAKQATTDKASIVGKTWKLIALNGQTIQSQSAFRTTPHLIFRGDENKVNGNSGCNGFFGTYELQPGNIIMFSQMGATKMACSPEIMQIEFQLFEAFEKTGKYDLSSDTLMLWNTDMTPLARFVASNVN